MMIEISPKLFGVLVRLSDFHTTIKVPWFCSSFYFIFVTRGHVLSALRQGLFLECATTSCKYDLEGNQPSSGRYM